MSKEVKILDDLTIGKIAAGEVIKAPYSVVKELIENSIDAGASAITLGIKEGGKKYIRVTDNGIGIKEKYVEQVFMRHSTSKIKNISDLDSINSLGFRGEALASIAAVSQIEMITRTKDQKHGILVRNIGGRIETIRKTGCPVGTTIIVRNLFFNTPARLKFMKSNSVETTRISKIITRLALSDPDISFKYINNNTIFITPGDGMLSQAILSIFDKNTFKNMIPLEKNRPHMKLQGYIGQPSFVRGNRSLQIVFVNGRYVESKLISGVIEKAYKEKVIINKHPVCVLNLGIDPSEIDINVHPSKTEIKFKKEKQVQEFIYKSITKTLKEGTTIPEISITEHGMQKNRKSNFIPIYPTSVREVDRTEKSGGAVGNTGIAENTNIVENALVNEINEDYEDNTGDHAVQFTFLDTLLNQYKIIGQIFNTYIILEKEQSIYLIDQHAAHERLIYNRFIDEIKNENVVSQRLVEPKILELSNEDYILLSDNIDLFIKLGFYIEDFGINAVIIREVPAILGKPRNFSFVYEILDGIDDNSSVTDYFESTIIERACKKAIKASDRLDYYEIKQLVDELHTLTPPLTCPHGRPIILTMKQYDIEKYFKRIQ